MVTLSIYAMSTFDISSYAMSTYDISTYAMSTHDISTYAMSTCDISTYAMCTYGMFEFHTQIHTSHALRSSSNPPLGCLSQLAQVHNYQRGGLQGYLAHKKMPPP